MAESLYDSLYRNIASMPQGGQGGMPARKAEKPGLLDYVWGVAAGYNPNDIRRGFDAREQQAAAQEAMRAQQAQIASGITDPTERALFQTSPQDWAKNVGQQFAPQVIGAGAAQAVAGRRTVEQPSFTESGDTILRRTSEGIAPVFTRTTPSIAEQVQQGRLAQDERQFGVTSSIAQQNADTSREVGLGNLDIARQNAEAKRLADERARLTGTPADIADKSAISGYEASNQRFKAILDSVQGNPDTGTPPAFELSPLAALKYEAELRLGTPSPEAAAWANYQSEIDSAVSDALRLNTGPQTDQDAIREARALLSYRNNKEYVTTRLPTVMANNDRLRAARQELLRERQAGGQTAPAAATGPIAVNPTTGARVQWNGSAWVPL